MVAKVESHSGELHPRVGFIVSNLSRPAEQDAETILEKLVKIGAKVVSHGRYVAFQMAEVAVPRDLIRTILRRMDELRPLSLAAG